MPDPSPRQSGGHDARRQGHSMLRWSLFGVVVSVLVGTAWIAWKAVANPDVRLKPQWVAEGEAFDHSFWSPLLFTVVVGGGIVGWVLWKAYRRISAGEDLYAGRMGRGVRRRGERHVNAPEEA